MMREIWRRIVLVGRVLDAGVFYVGLTVGIATVITMESSLFVGYPPWVSNVAAVAVWYAVVRIVVSLLRE